MNDATWQMTWPIVDMTTPLNDLLGAAMQDIAVELRNRIYRQAAPVEWHITRQGAGIVLVADVPVALPDRSEEPDRTRDRRRQPDGGLRRGAAREDVLELLRLGETPEAIAQRLGITVDAVKRAQQRGAAA